MIGKFIGIMKTGTNDYRPVVIAMEANGVPTIVVALKHSMLLVEGDCVIAGTEFKHVSKLPSDKAIRWDFEKNFDLLKSPKIVLNGEKMEITAVNPDGTETSVIGVENNTDTLKTASTLIEATKKNLVGGGEWKNGAFEVMPGGALEVEKGNLTVDTKTDHSFIEAEQVNPFLTAVMEGKTASVSHNAKCMVYVFKLADNICLVEKSKLRPKKGKSSMSETTQPAQPQPAQPQVAPPVVTTNVQPTPQTQAAPAAPAVPPQVPAGPAPAAPEAVKEPDIDDALNALSAIEDIVSGVKVQSRIIRAVFKIMAKKSPSKDLEAKYAELKKKIDNLKASL